MPVVLVLSLPFLFMLARRPVLRRLALRNAARRPRETLLVILGALLGTAIMTGSFVVGDTLEASIRRSAFTQLGPVDELVETGDPALAVRVRAALAPLAADPSSGVDGLLPLTVVTAAVARDVDDDVRAEPTANLIEADFDQARAFGRDPAATGIEGPTPGPGEAAVGRDLARTLDVSAGDVVTAHAYGRKLQLTVVRILPRLGVAGFHMGFGSESPNLFVAPGTLAGLAVAAPPGSAPPLSIVAVSNEGGVVEGAAHTGRVTAGIERALGTLPAAVSPAKRDLLETADEQGAQFTELFSSIGAFSVLAGILLVINIFVMLAQERKTELGMLRAVGLKRSSLVGSFSLEGWLYAIASSAVGIVVGLGVGRVIVLVTAGIFSGGSFSLELTYTATAASVQKGFVFGFVVSLLTVFLTSLSVARLNVIRAIRDLPEPAVKRQRLVWVVLGAVALVAGLGWTVAGLRSQEPVGVLVGPAVAALGAVRLLGRLVPRRPLVTVAAGLTLVWAVSCFDVATEAFRNPDISLFVFDGVVLTAAAVALVTQNQETIGALVRRVAGRGQARMSLRLGLAYPLARRFRTGMTLTMYALVVFTLASITLFSGVFSAQLDQFTDDLAGGFDLRLASNPTNPVPVDPVRATPGVTGVAALSVVDVEFRPAGKADFERWPAGGFDAAFVDGGPPALSKRPAGTADAAAAYRAVLADPDAVIVDEFFLQNGGGPSEDTMKVGDRLDVRDPASGRSRRLTVAGLAKSGFAPTPALLGRPAVESLVGARAVPNVLYVATAPGVDAREMADSLNGRFIEQGADAVSFREEVGDGLAAQERFFRLMQGYLALGLVVGIAGLGVVMVRAVRERRRQIGVLRALGFPSSAVRRAFITESGFVATEGVLIGVALAVVSTWRLMTNGAFGDGLRFVVPWGQMAVLVVFTLVASLLATAAPARQASRIRPAVALRITD